MHLTRAPTRRSRSQLHCASEGGEQDKAITTNSEKGQTTTASGATKRGLSMLNEDGGVLLRCERYSMCKSQVNIRKDIIKDCREARPLWSLRRMCSTSSSSGSWIDSSQARIALYLAIVLNTSFYIVWSYLQESGQTEHLNPWMFFGIEVLFVLGFGGELLLRAQKAPGHFLVDRWSFYDLFVLACAFFDLSVLNFVPSLSGAHHLVVQLMPALQILRLGRLVVELRLIIRGIVSAMQAVLWSMALLLLVIYSCAVVFTSILGTTARFQKDEVAVDLFGTLVHSMFTLFTFATLQDFSTSVRHFMDDSWAGAGVAIAIVAFILFTNLALLNLVTAVMVDSIIDILPKKRTEKLAHERAVAVRRLESLFLMMDKDGDRKLTLEEFQQGVEHMEEVKLEMTRLQMAAFDIKELFMLIDFNDNGTVSVDEFIEGLLRVAPGPASKKELMGVQYDLHRMWNMLGAGQEKLLANLEECIESNTKMLDQSSQKGFADVEAGLKAWLEERLDALERHLDESRMSVLEGVHAAGFAVQSSVVKSVEATTAAGQSFLLEALDERGVSPLMESLAELRGELAPLSKLVEDSSMLATWSVESSELAEACRRQLEALSAEVKAKAGSASTARCHDRGAKPPHGVEEVASEGPLSPTLLGRRVGHKAGLKVLEWAEAADDAAVTRLCARRGEALAPASPRAASPAVAAPARALGPTLPAAAAPTRAHTLPPAAAGPLPPAAEAAMPPLPPLPRAYGGHLAQEAPAGAAPTPPQRLPPVPGPWSTAASPQTTSAEDRVAALEQQLAAADAAAARLHGELQRRVEEPMGGTLLPLGASTRASRTWHGERPSQFQHTAWAASSPQAAREVQEPLDAGSTRLEHIQWLVKQQGWSSVAFDRLVLHLDRLGIELSIPEQDQLKRVLYRSSCMS